MKNTILVFVTIFLASLFKAAIAQEVSVNNVYPGKLKIQGFNVSSKTEVDIKGSAGVFVDNSQRMVFYGWIIDSDTRKVVWHLLDDVRSKNRLREEGFFDFEEKVTLESGNYELIYTGVRDNNNNGNWNIDGFDHFMNRLFSSRSRERYRDRYREDLSIRVNASGLKAVDAKELLDNKTKDAVVSINRVGDNATMKERFSLKDETTLKIYAVGEGGRREVYDYVWIYDARNHERVWQMDYGNTSFAGGADKNYVANKTITLPKGSYIVSYSSDDSHSFREWNSLPPDDPQFWGVTIWANSPKDKANVIPFKEDNMTKAMVELIRVGDDEYLSQGIKLNADAKVRILCLGEKGSDGFVDSGWIMDANTREIVWEMGSHNAEYAGGDRKNEMVDEVISLDKGAYIVYYATDDSHSFRRWNASQPHEQDRWGITLWALNDNVKYELFDEKEYKSDKVLVEILRVRDREYLKETFTLKEDTRLRIKAIGEGSDGDMHDYGWIENRNTGRVVWEMTYRNSDYAGGARKNRMYNDVVILPKGEYRVYYESDGSHSYRDWNASPPRDQESYGISLMIE
ncbi:MAG: hypothetical protein AAF693_06485 [Bacteroidota bacterium]